MKLFGDTGKHQHSVEAKENKKNERAANVRKPFDIAAVFSAPIWKKLRKPLIVIGCVIIFFLIVLLVYSIWEKPPETVSNFPNTQFSEKPVIQAPVAETTNPVIVETPEEETPALTAMPEPTEEPIPTGRREDCYTFAILAYDQYQASTDTILVGRLDAAAGALDFVSIPRDTLVNVSWGVKKLNTVLAGERNDINRFLEHLGSLIGYTVDCYAIVDIRAAEKLVDCIGGVYYNVPRDMDYDDPTQELSIHIPKGYQLLNGENAVKVLRFRVGNDNTGYVNGDLGRISTQQDFLKTMTSQLLTLGNVPNLEKAIEIFQKYVQTNMSSNNIAYVVHEFLKLDEDSVHFHTMPGAGVNIRGGSYLEVCVEDWIAMLNKCLNPFYQDITADNLIILQKNGNDGAVSISGETVPITSFYDFSQYSG